ncbi:hypothetical protein QTP88_026808 [Uroleucon formosanum]
MSNKYSNWLSTAVYEYDIILFWVHVTTTISVTVTEIDGITKQKVIINFLVKLGKTSLQIHEMLSALKKTALFKWIKRFQDGHEDCKDNGRPGLLLTTCDDQSIEHMQSLVLFHQRMTVRMLADMLSIKKLSVHTILTENLRLRKLSQSF